MQTAFDENTSSEARRPEAYWAAVADLVSLIQRTRTLDMRPATGDGDAAVLDDGAPAAASAISTCNLRLREALQFLLEARQAEMQRFRAC